MIHQTKTTQNSIYNNNQLTDLLICQTFFCQMLIKSQFAKLSPSKLSRYRVVYSKINQLMLGPAESAIPWVTVIYTITYFLLYIKNSVQVV